MEKETKGNGYEVQEDGEKFTLYIIDVSTTEGKLPVGKFGTKDAAVNYFKNEFAMD